ncbi:HD-GYP domain-containing protein [Dendrosporobacter sp. 1207_IL3150]|uniref:HD-GYP domain-containing protein n=1 Tax=Dendrosporobacter sp. 1207_IL3150 TaxID=3084054 RepID=UPI002FDA5C1A
MASYINKNYLISDVVPAMILGKDVHINGRVALSEGLQLTASLINRLKLWGITSLFIREELFDIQAITSPTSNIQQQFFDTYANTVNIIKNAFENIRFFNEVAIKDLTLIANSHITPLSNAVGVINHLHMVRRQDDYTFHHSINVAVISGILGRWLGYSEKDINELVLTGLLHDSGKTKIPLTILNKPAKLTKSEMEIMKLHSVHGYMLIRALPEVSQQVSYGVLQHHERFDGSGYPLKIKADKIQPFARIIAVADIYDAMTSDRVYRSKLTPFTVVELMVEEMYEKLDPRICSVFLNNVRDYFIGNIVKLSDGREAEVVHMGHFIATRPTVRVIEGEFIDLEKRQDISITALIKA